MPSTETQGPDGSHQNRDIHINIRARKRQRDLIDQAAELLGKSRSDFILETVCRAAEDVLLDQLSSAHKLSLVFT